MYFSKTLFTLAIFAMGTAGAQVQLSPTAEFSANGSGMSSARRDRTKGGMYPVTGNSIYCPGAGCFTVLRKLMAGAELKGMGRTSGNGASSDGSVEIMMAIALTLNHDLDPNRPRRSTDFSLSWDENSGAVVMSPADAGRYSFRELGIRDISPAEEAAGEMKRMVLFYSILESLLPEIRYMFEYWNVDGGRGPNFNFKWWEKDFKWGQNIKDPSPDTPKGADINVGELAGYVQVAFQQAPKSGYVGACPGNGCSPILRNLMAQNQVAVSTPSIDSSGLSPVVLALVLTLNHDVDLKKYPRSADLSLSWDETSDALVITPIDVDKFTLRDLGLRELNKGKSSESDIERLDIFYSLLVSLAPQSKDAIKVWRQEKGRSLDIYLNELKSYLGSHL